MILTQKFHSASEIDAEFIPALEELLQEYVPSFEWIKQNESQSPENTYFHYYLFFSNKRNTPVGFTQVAIQPLRIQKLSWWDKLLKRPAGSKSKKAYWRIPGSTGLALATTPVHNNEVCQKLSTLVQEFSKRDDIYQQFLAMMGSDLDVNFTAKSPFVVPGSLLKSSHNYEGHLNGLGDETKGVIKESWKFLYQQLKLQLGDYNQFKSVFEYKNASDSYKKLKKHPLIKALQTQQTYYLTLEKDKNIQALVFLIKGQGHHYFFDWLNFDEQIPNLALIQMAIMKYYELEDAYRLHYLGNLNDPQLFSGVGFTCSDQTLLDIIRDEK